MESDANTVVLPISRILSSHPRERLFVHPLVWTQRHLDLLGCEFRLSDTVSRNYDDDELAALSDKGDPAWNAWNARMAKALAESSDYVDKILAVEKIWQRRYKNDFTSRYVPMHPPTHTPIPTAKALTHFRFSFVRHELYLYFARRRVARLECKTYSLISASEEDIEPPPPNHIAWLDLDEIASLRRDKFFHERTGRWTRPSPPFVNRATKLLRRASPEDPLRDPYMAAILVALAQSQRRGSSVHPQQRKDENGMYWRAVLMVTGTDHEWLYIYRTDVSAEFLDGLDYPDGDLPRGEIPAGGALPSSSLSRLNITRRRLLVKPYETLPQRMNAALREAYYASRQSVSTETNAAADSSWGRT